MYKSDGAKYKGTVVAKQLSDYKKSMAQLRADNAGAVFDMISSYPARGEARVLDHTKDAATFYEIPICLVRLPCTLDNLN